MKHARNRNLWDSAESLANEDKRWDSSDTAPGDTNAWNSEDTAVDDAWNSQDTAVSESIGWNSQDAWSNDGDVEMEMAPQRPQRRRNSVDWAVPTAPAKGRQKRARLSNGKAASASRWDSLDSAGTMAVPMDFTVTHRDVVVGGGGGGGRPGSQQNRSRSMSMETECSMDGSAIERLKSCLSRGKIKNSKYGESLLWFFFDSFCDAVVV